MTRSTGAKNDLRFRYCWSVAVDPGDSETVVLSAAPGPRQAHTRESAESAIYQRTGGGAWREVRAGLPAFQRHPRPGRGDQSCRTGRVLCRRRRRDQSSDAGVTWQALKIDWPEAAVGSRVHGLAAVDVP